MSAHGNLYRPTDKGYNTYYFLSLTDLFEDKGWLREEFQNVVQILNNGEVNVMISLDDVIRLETNEESKQLVLHVY